MTGIICLGLGLAGGVVLAEFVGDHGKPVAAAGGDGEEAKGKGDTPKMGMPGGGKGGKAPGGKGGNKAGPGGNKGGPGGGAGGGGFGAGPSSKNQLAQLISKLDLLTAKPLSVELTPEQKKQAKELIAELETKDGLTEPEAKAKLDALLKVVEGNKQALKDAGFFWPGEGGVGFGGPPPAEENIFRAAPNADRLKSLQSTLGK